MKAVLFDFNGTLYNDTRLHIAAWSRFCRERFNLNFTEDEVRRHFIGPDNTMIFRDVLGLTDLDEAALDALSEAKESIYRSIARSDPDNLRLIDGVPEMMDALCAKGVRIAMATASPYSNVRFYLDDLGMAKWFSLDRIVYVDSGLPGKPDPAFYLEAARRLNVPVSECVIVEDSMTGIQAAGNAKPERIIAIDTTVPEEVLRNDPSISAVIHDYRHFLEIIGL